MNAPVEDAPVQVLNDSEHFDSRMHLKLRDMSRFYDPPQKPITSITVGDRANP